MAVLKLWATRKPNLDFEDITVRDNQLYFDSTEKTFYIGVGKDEFETVSVGSELEPASETTLGGIKIGSGLAIDQDGFVSVVGDSGFSGNYNDLTNKPNLALYQLTATAFSGNYNDLTNKPALFSGNYNDLTNKPTIPTDVNQLTDNSNLLGGNYVLPTASDVVLGGIKIGSGLAISESGVVSVISPGTTDYNNLINKPFIPSKTSDLSNDAGFITANQVPQTFGFSVGADDSVLIPIGAGESIKFIGINGISTGSDLEGNITISGSYNLDTVTDAGKRKVMWTSQGDIMDQGDLALLAFLLVHPWAPWNCLKLLPNTPC